MEEFVLLTQFPLLLWEPNIFCGNRKYYNKNNIMHLGIKLNNSPWSICWRLQAWDVKAVSGLKIDIWCNWLCSFLFITEYEGDDWRGGPDPHITQKCCCTSDDHIFGQLFAAFHCSLNWVMWDLRAAYLSHMSCCLHSRVVKTFMVVCNCYIYKGNIKPVSWTHKVLYEWKWHWMNGTLLFPPNTQPFNFRIVSNWGSISIHREKLCPERRK